MNIQTKKYKLIEWITNIQDINLINKLVEMSDKSDWWDELSEIEKASIQKGITDLEAGKFVEHSEVKKLYEKYL